MTCLTPLTYLTCSNIQFELLPEKYHSYSATGLQKQNLITGLNYKVWDVVVVEQEHPTAVKAMAGAARAAVTE